MRLDVHSLIEDWNESTLASIPDNETDYYEYKSSQISIEKLKKEICVAASAFWNSGGGIFIAGVDDNGKVDGGIPELVGNQRLRDWADQVLAHVEPVGPYSIITIEAQAGNSQILAQHVVLVIAFGESRNAPHMAPDYRYYIRAGTHSLPAGHFIVEAIRSQRGLHQPYLRGLLQLNHRKNNVVQLILLAVNEAAALDVHLSFEPLPHTFHQVADIFPLKIPIVDRDNPFELDIVKTYELSQTFGGKPTYLKLQYQDVSGKVYHESQLLDPYRSLSPIPLGSDDVGDIKKSLKELVRQMKRLNGQLKAVEVATRPQR